MNNKTTNKVNMINATITYAESDLAATAGITMFVTVLGQVKTKMVLINSLNIVAGGTSTGVTLDTNALRKAMETIAMKCASGTYAYASSVNNNTLKATVDYTPSKLAKAKKEDIDDVCEGIQIATDDNSAAVIPFGVAATDPADLLTAINLYRTASQNPRQAIITKNQANKNVIQMVDEVIDDLLEEQLDKMVDTLKVSNRNYRDAWQSAREVIDLGSTTAKVRGTVKDNMDIPLSNVKFYIYETGTTNLVKMVITDALGKFNASQLPAGFVDFKWELATYNIVTETNVKITAGKELKRRVVMTKI